MDAKIVILDDDKVMGSLLKCKLAKEGFTTKWLEKTDALIEYIKQSETEVVLTDLHMPGTDGFGVVRQIRQNFPKVPVIIITGQNTTDTAIEAIKIGAFDYLVKPLDEEKLIQTVTKAVESHRMMKEKVGVGAGKESRMAIIGVSRAMMDAYKEVGRVAAQSVTVLIRGETGTGKELFARAIYQHSARAKQTFLAVNCAAIPETLLESELFGHEKGAFTGATQRRVGRFEQCHEGTLFLDEIGDMPLATQAKLLRVLQEHSIQRLGSAETVKVDVRVIAATNCDLEKMVKEKKFREDLFHRLDVVSIRLPSLRERKEDIPPLIQHILKKCGEELNFPNLKIQQTAQEVLCAQQWPGNVRQLENTLRRAILHSSGFTITPEHIEQALHNENEVEKCGVNDWQQLVADFLIKARTGKIESAQPEILKIVEQELYRQAIQAANGNQAKAARWIGVSRVTMHQKLLTYGLLDSRIAA